MSQKDNSSMISGTQINASNADLKYQKALKQIGKLIDTNKALKAQAQQKQYMLSTELSEISTRLAQMERKYEESEMNNQRMHQIMEELQDTNQDLRKQYNTLERQVGYLNQVLTQQNAQLKKLSLFKDEKGISQLLRSYQQTQQTHKNQINRLQEQVLQLKTTIDRIEQDLTQQTQMRQRYEEQYNIIGLEINKYRELNNYLMDKNQHILSNQKNKNDRGIMSQHQIDSIVIELKRQLQLLRNHQYQAEDISEKQYVKNYEMLMQEKNNIALQLARTKDQLAISQQRIKELYEVQQKMSAALARSDILLEENNMLKNRITILESKDIIENVGFDQDSDLKVFEEKINFMMNKTDPLNTIKNSDDNTHFIQMKSYITELQAKLQSVIEQKQFIDKKYKNIKMKFAKKAEQKIILEESNKLLKGKLQGYERLTEKLNYELEKSMQAHEDEIVKMVAITNNLVSKKVEESRNASAFIKLQFDSELQKAESVEKTMAQQLDTFKLQNGALKIKLTDLDQKLKQSSELLQIYQNKFNDLSNRYKELEQQNTSINEKLIKFEKIHHEEKARHETILVQKQAVSNKLSLITQELNQRTHQLDESLRLKELNYESELKRVRQQMIRYKEEAETIGNENKRLLQELFQHRMTQNKTFSSLKEDNNYIRELESKWNESRQLNNSLETELISLRGKINSYDQVKTQLDEIETDLMKKNDQANDLKRLNLGLKKQIDSLQLMCNDLSEDNKLLLKEANMLKQKLLQPISLSSINSKQLEYKKTIQRLHEEIAILESAVRDQKRGSARLLNELQHYKQEIGRLEEMISKNKQREQSLLETISKNNNQLLGVQEELFQYRSKHSQATYNATLLGQDLQKTTQDIAFISQELNVTKYKLNKVQTNYQNMMRDLNGTKNYIQQTQKLVKRLNSVERLEWEQQRQKDNLSFLVDALNRIMKNAGSLQFSNTSSNQEYSFVPASSFGNLENNSIVQSDNFRTTSGDNYTRIQFMGGSFGNSDDHLKTNPITNDSLRHYAGSINSESTTNVNFSSQSFGRPSQPFNSYSPYQTFEVV